MIKILHAADLHLDSPFGGYPAQESERLRRQLRSVPEQLAAICRQEKCDLMLLAGDVFDGAYTKESLLALKNALQEVGVPVFIAPGNHDFCAANSPWEKELWPENVHIFRSESIERVVLAQLDCCVYGAGFHGMDCPALLEKFHADGGQRYRIGLFHGDPVQANSPYNPISQGQIEASGLDYLALGHIHKMGMLRKGKTLCAWPGCPMGRGFDEVEEKGVLVVTLGQETAARFVPLDVPHFYDWEISVQESAREALAEKLPAVGNDEHYRITLTGTCPALDLEQIYNEFSAFPNLELRDRTRPPLDAWGSAGADSLEGVYFQMLRRCFDEEDGQSKQIALLAAQISRNILDGNEVVLP